MSGPDDSQMQCQRETTHSRQSDERMQSDDPEEYYESDSDEEYNTRMFGIYQALPVDGEPDWSIREWLPQYVLGCLHGN